MAKAKAICTCGTCGKEFIREKICRNRRDADSWEIWATNYFDECTDCYKIRLQNQREAENAEAAKANEEAGLIALTGSVKQIAWAESVRAKALQVVNEYCTTEQGKAFLDWLRQIDRAAWWIDHRDHFGGMIGLRQIVAEYENR